MTDDLVERLKVMRKNGPAQVKYYDELISEAIAKLSAQVPRLPEGYEIGATCGGAFGIRKGSQVIFEANNDHKRQFLAAFLPKPSVDHMTEAQNAVAAWAAWRREELKASATVEPVKAAGDGERKAFDVWYESKHWLPYKFEDALREAFNAGVAWGRPLTTPSPEPIAPHHDESTDSVERESLVDALRERFALTPADIRDRWENCHWEGHVTRAHFLWLLRELDRRKLDERAA